MSQNRHGVADVAAVVQMHTLGMFFPSFFTGSLIARFGVLRIMLGGAALLTAAQVAPSFSGIGFASFAFALGLLGVGWNFLYVGGTTLLTHAYRPAERGRAQAANDLLILVVSLVSSLGAGALLHAVGWRLMNAILLPWLLAAIVAVWWLSRVSRHTPLRGQAQAVRQPPGAGTGRARQALLR